MTETHIPSKFGQRIWTDLSLSFSEVSFALQIFNKNLDSKISLRPIFVGELLSF